MAPIYSIITIVSLAISSILAHPGHNVAQEAAERAEFLRHKPRSVGSCSSQLQRRGHTTAALARRSELATKAQQKRGLTGKPFVRRAFAEYNISHASTANFVYGEDETALFSDNSSCILSPEVTQGPYYVDGELIRRDVMEDQEGVPLFLDIQFLDTSTCDPVPAVFIDLWHCNSTGVYSGVSASGNGNSNTDTSNLNATFLRGVQSTDVNGVVQFETIVPGHYVGRTNHIHIMSHAVDNTTIRTNGTLLGTSGTTHASHVGQLFFDQELLSLVEASLPYSSNTQAVTTNEEDSILGQEADGMDPFLQYILLGDSIEDGILAWISIGIDSTTNSAVNSAATIYEIGGIANENSMGGGMGGDAPGGNGTTNGTMPDPPAI